MRRPVTNCELTSPLRVYSPAPIFPLTLSGKLSEMLAPILISSSFRGERGLSGSLPEPFISVLTPRAQTTGSRKRMVEPLSLQSMRAEAGGSSIGVTDQTAPSFSMTAPRFSRQETVALMSSEVVFILILLFPFARQAQISALWAKDFDAIPSMPPHKGVGVILISIKILTP